MQNELRLPRMGLLLLGAERFCAIGEGTKRGTYLSRKTAEAERLRRDCQGFSEVVFPGMVFNDTQMAAAIDTFSAAKVDFVLAIYLSWAEDYTWNLFLRDMPTCPVLFAHMIRDAVTLSDTHDEDEFAEYLGYGGLVGMQEASGNNANTRRPMLETAIGTWAELKNRAAVFGNAARARSVLRKSRVGLLACFNEAMHSTYVHPYDIFHKMGPSLHFLSVAELSDTVETISEKEAEARMEAILSRYEVLPNVDKPKCLASVRASMAMEQLAEKYKLDLLVLNDIDPILFKHIGLRPGFYPTCETVRTVVVPEGDIGGGLACYILRLLTGDHVHFIEPFHIDLPNENFAAGHAGPNDYTDPKGKTKISIDVRFAKSPYRYAGAPFAWHVFSEGRKTMLHCSEHNGRFLLAAANIESLPCEHFLATYSHGLFRPVGQSSAQLFEKLLRIGVTQHYGIVSGDVLPALSDLAFMLDCDYKPV